MFLVVDQISEVISFLQERDLILYPETHDFFADDQEQVDLPVAYAALFALLNLDHKSEIATILSKLELDDKRVLDLGCSSGVVSQIMAEQGAHVTGVDYSEGSLEIARTLPRPSGLPGSIEFIHHNLEEPMSFENSSFDIIFLKSGHGMVFYTENAADEYRRLLRQGGTLVFLNIIPQRIYNWNLGLRYFEFSLLYNMISDEIDVFTHEPQEGWYPKRVAIEQEYDMKFHTFGLDRHYPASEVTELSTQMNFRLFGEYFLRHQMEKEHLEYLIDVHNPQSDHYLFDRKDLHISHIYELGIGSLG